MPSFFYRDLTNEAKNILSSYTHRCLSKDVFSDCWIKLLASLYAYVEPYTPFHVDKKIREVLIDYIFDLEDVFTESEIDILLKEYAEVIECCCDAYGNDVISEQFALYSEPKELSLFISELFDFGNNLSNVWDIYLPFAGMGAMIAECSYANILSEEINDKAWAISAIRNFQPYINIYANASDPESLENKPTWDIIINDSFKTLSSKGKKFDYIIFTPPFGIKSQEGYTEYDAVKLAIQNRLCDGGTLCCVLPASFLFSDSLCQKELRDFLIENGYINTIIALPKIFSPLTNVSTVLIVVKKIFQEKIKFVDGTKFITSGIKENGGGTFDYQRLLSAIYDNVSNIVIDKTLGELVESPNLIIPALALLSSQPLKNGEKIYRLGDLVKISSKRATQQNLKTMSPLPKYVIENLFETPYNSEIHLNAAPMDNQLYYIPLAGVNHFVFVDSPSLVVQFFNKSAKVAKITNEGNILVQAKRNSFFFKVDETIILSDYLLKCLQSESVLSQTAVYQNFIYEKDFLNLLVVVPSLEQQNEELMKSLASNVDSLNSLVNKSFETYKQEIHTRKHALSQNISALSSYWNKINNIRAKNDDIIDGSKSVGIVNPVQVSSILDSISNLISTIEKQVEHIADVNYDWGQSVEINPHQIISNFIRKNATPEFVMTLSNRIDHKTKVFYAPLLAVEHVFTNIVTNAKEHGFTDLARNDYEIAFDWFEENGNIVILISNNGDPLKEGVTEDMVFTYGFSTMFNVNGHNGIGGSESKSIMEKFGNIEIVSNPNERFPVTYKLTFNKTNF